MITNMIRVYVLISFYDENGLHKAGSVTLVKEEDFNPLYMKAIPAPPTVDAYTKEETNALLDTKQDTLTAGDGITISDNVISAEGGSGSVIDNIQFSGSGSYVQSMDIDSDTYSFSTVDNDQPAYDSDILASVDLNGNSYKLFYLDNFQYNSDGYVTSFDDGDSNNYAFCNVGNVMTDTNDLVESIDVNDTTYYFASDSSLSVDVAYNQSTNSYDIELARNGTTFSSAQLPQGVQELDDLSDVDVGHPSDGQVLTYDSTSLTWKPANPAGGSNQIAQFEIADLTSTHYTIDTLPVMQPFTFSVVSGSTDAADFYSDTKSIAQITNSGNLYFFATKGSIQVGQQSNTGYLCLVPGQYAGQNYWILLQRAANASSVIITKVA